MLGQAGEEGGGGVLAPLARRLEAEQERWFCWLPVLIGVGAGFYFWLPEEPALLTALAPLAAAIALWIWSPRTTLASLAIACLLALSLGFALAKVRVEWVSAPVLAKQINSVEVRGYVELVEPRPSGGQRLTLRVTQLGDLPAAARPARVRITTNKANPALQAGAAVTSRASLMPPSAPALPGGYDFGREAWFLGLGAVGYSLSGAQADASAAPPPFDLRMWGEVQRLRQAIGARVLAALPGETGAIAVALITGERGGISEATTNAFRDSGLLHILSISGFHMAVMAGSVFFLVRIVLSAFPALALVYPIKKWAAAAALLGAVAYLTISGASFATVRSAIMISIMFIAVILDRPALALRNVVLAATLILVLFPESLFDVGFQMSFAAVLALICVYEALRGRSPWLLLPQGASARLMFFFAGIVLSTLVASAAVAPFAAFHFHKSQQYAVLANLIALPICNLVVMPAALAALLAMPLGLEALPLWVMGWGVDAMVWTAERVARMPGAVTRIPAMPQAAFLLMVAGGLWLMLWQTRWRVLGLVLIGAGMGLAPTQRLPDLLVGNDGTLVAARAADGTLFAVGATRQSYELERWLEHDGDTRNVEEAGKLGKGSIFACDGIGCRANVKGLTVAVARHPAAFSDDCRRAGILIAGMPSPRGCTAPKTVVDFFAARRQGTHALYIDMDGAIRIETVAQRRGARPWSMPPARASPPVPAARAAAELQ